jgi:hypothetical protein
LAGRQQHGRREGCLPHGRLVCPHRCYRDDGFRFAGAGRNAPDGITSAALVDAVLFGAIAFGIFKHSRFAAVAGFVLYLIEKLYAISQQGVLAAGVLGVVFLIGFLNAIRGTFAYQKLLAEQAKSAPIPFS